uniref:Integrase catalytic domain-containing protein n=1 Tax=Vitis vinifera TaxID=29760 RepID=A5ANJ8_VITVI|nr:hypothetical protein VITISV_010069 [Vitis vinifera]
MQEKGRFPSQPHQNPKGIHEVEAHDGESSQVRDIKALITLRSGKKVELPTPKPHIEKEEEEEETEKMEEIKGNKKDNNERKEDHDSTVKVNIPLLDMIKQVPTYAKFLKDLCTIKRGLNVNKKAFLTEQVSAIIQCKSPLKYKDPGCPTISVMVGGTVVEKALLDLGAGVNLQPYSIYKQLGLGELKLTSIILSLVDRSVKILRGIIEDVLVQVDNVYYPVDFVVLDTDLIVKETNYVPIILGRSFLATSNAIINCRNGLMQLMFGNTTLELNIFYMSKNPITPEEDEGPEEVCIIDTLVEEHCNQKMQEKLNESLGDLEEGLSEPSDLLATLPAIKEEPPKLNLKSLPTELKYTYLEKNKKCPVVISSSLTTPQEMCLLEVLKRCKKAIEWQIYDLKGNSPLVCTHHIYMEEEAKPICQPQRRLNPHMQEVVQAKVLKLLQADIIYPISDSSWVNPTQVVPKKSGITVVQNEKGEEVGTCLTSGWMVCIDYRKLNAVTRKYHFPLPFIDQVLERVSKIDVEDQEKSTFTCPFGTYAYRRMPFGLCNAPATFQRCMLSIFSDMVERIMDDITIYGSRFEECLDLVLNWEKCHFMVQQGIVLGHIISKKGIEVDKAKVELIIKLPPPTTIKGVRCQRSFEQLKQFLTTALIVRAPNWKLPFEVMCDVSDFAIGAVIEFNLQIKDKKGVENVVVNHLSKLAITHNSLVLPINDDFPEESLMLLENAPWYAHIANYLVISEVPSFNWPSLFKDAHTMCRSCDRCQRLGKLTRRNQMPMNPILIIDLFDVWGIDFMGHFPMSFGNSYILVGVDYVSKWVEASPCKQNDHRVVLKFLKENIFSIFGVPKAIISDGGTHFCSKPFETLLAKYGVRHKTILSMSPYRLVYAKACHLPVEVEYKAWWAIKKVNMDLTKAGIKRCLDLNEMEELRNDAYINSKVVKQRMKRWHD